MMDLRWPDASIWACRRQEEEGEPRGYRADASNGGLLQCNWRAGVNCAEGLNWLLPKMMKGRASR